MTGTVETIEQIHKKALDAQDACNVSGLVHSWGRWCPVIRQDAERLSIPFNDHPVNVLMSNKIASLTNSDSLTTFSRAYETATSVVANMAPTENKEASQP